MKYFGIFFFGRIGTELDSLPTKLTRTMNEQIIRIQYLSDLPRLFYTSQIRISIVFLFYFKQ